LTLPVFTEHGYRILRNDAVLAETTDTGYVDRAVTKGITYIYEAIAFDAADNTSPPSNSATASLGGGSNDGGGKGNGKGGKNNP